MITTAELEEAVAELRDKGMLGRSALSLRLFDFLSENSIAGRAPKESEVAIEVFGRRPDFDPSQDAVARVYVHKLRKRLEELRRAGVTRLAIPRGEYRLTLPEPAAELETVQSVRQPARLSLTSAPMLGVLGALVVIVLAALIVMRPPSAALKGGGPLPDPIWSPLLANGYPTLIVAGDYYIFSEIGDDGIPDRLVRDFNVNSRADLDQLIMKDPARGAFYAHAGLSYLPVGSAPAILDIAPVLARGKQVQVITASQLTPPMLKENNIVYVGYLSGLGLLRDATFAGSRFAIGATYDDLIDHKGGRHYLSQGGAPRSAGAMYRDFGYFSSFAGPDGNRFVIIAGTRDAGLRQMAETATDATALKQIVRQAGRARGIEALYVIDGMDEFNVAGRLVTSSPLNEPAIWSRDAAKREVFPKG